MMKLRTCIIIVVLTCFFVNEGTSKGGNPWEDIGQILQMRPYGIFPKMTVYRLQKSLGNFRDGQDFIGRLTSSRTNIIEFDGKLSIENLSFYQYHRNNKKMTVSHCHVGRYTVDKNFRASGGIPRCGKPRSVLTMYKKPPKDKDGNAFTWLAGLLYYLDLHGEKGVFLFTNSYYGMTLYSRKSIKTTFDVKYDVVKLNEAESRSKFDLTKVTRSECTAKISTTYKHGGLKLEEKPSCSEFKRII